MQADGIILKCCGDVVPYTSLQEGTILNPLFTNLFVILVLHQMSYSTAGFIKYNVFQHVSLLFLFCFIF